MLKQPLLIYIYKIDIIGNIEVGKQTLLEKIQIFQSCS
jgi:hypothetical protein